jgi:hypothetical protein
MGLPRGKTCRKSPLSFSQLTAKCKTRNRRARGLSSGFKGAQNLVLRVSATGSKTWAFLYSRPTNGRRCKLSLGAYPAIGLTKVKQDALALTVAVLGGKDPLHQRREEKAADTFEKLALRYLAEHERKYARGPKKSPATVEAERVLKVDVVPTIGSYRAEAVT